MRSRGALVVSLVVSACNLPERDNVHDPSNAPRASFRIAPLDGSRQTGFDFDASASEDLDHSKNLRYRWDWEFQASDLYDLDAWDFETTASIVSNQTLALSQSEIATLQETGGVGSIVRAVRLIVVTSDGRYGQSVASVTLHNDAPIPGTGEDLVVSVHTPLVVTLDGCGGSDNCTSTDPDGDPLGGWFWRQIGGAEVAILNSDQQVASFVIDGLLAAETRPFVFELTATDGLATVTSVVRVYREGQLWIAALNPPRIVRAFPEAVVVKEPALGNGPIAETDFYLRAMTVAKGGGLWIAETSTAWQGGSVSDDSSVVPLDRSLQPAPDLGLPLVTRWEISHTGNSLSEGIVSVASVEQNEGCAAILDLSAAVWVWLHPDFSSDVTLTSTTNQRSVAVARTATGAGEPACWTVDEHGGIGRLTVSGWSGLVPPATSNPVITAAASDDAGDLWVTTRFRNFTATPSDDVSTLRRVAMGDSNAVDIPLSPFVKSITGIEAWGQEGVWIRTQGEGLWLVDAAGTWTQHVLVSDGVAWDPFDITNFASDYSAKALWIARNDGSLYRFEWVDGVLVESGRMPVDEIYDLGGDAPMTLLTADRATGGIFIHVAGVSSTNNVIARMPSHLRRFELVPLVFDGGQLLATRQGTAWVLRPYRYGPTPQETRGLLKISTSGRKVVDLPLLTPADFTSPGDETIWTIEGLDAVHRDSRGAEITRIPVGQAGEQLKISADGNTVCVMRRNDATDSGGAFRIVDEGAPEALSVMVGGTAWNPVLALARENGECWFVAKRAQDFGCCIPAQGGPCASEEFPRIMKYPLGSTTPTVTTLFDDDFNPAAKSGNVRDYPQCPFHLSPDPLDGGVWVVTYDYDTSRVTRFTQDGIEDVNSRIGGGYSYPVTNRLSSGYRVGVQPCSGGAPAFCRRVFVMSDIDVTLRDQYGFLGATYEFEAGKVSALDVAP